MKSKDLINKSLALVLWAKDEVGNDDVAVFPGEFIEDGGNYYLKRDGDSKNPELLEEWLSRIVEVPDEQKNTLCDCEYYLSLTVGQSGDAEGSLEAFGLRWPD